MFVYFSADNGKVEVSVEQKKIGSSKTATGLAKLLIKAKVNVDSDDIFCSSSIDFADEYGFNHYNDARDLIEEAIDLVAEAA